VDNKSKQQPNYLKDIQTYSKKLEYTFILNNSFSDIKISNLGALIISGS